MVKDPSRAEHGEVGQVSRALSLSYLTIWRPYCVCIWSVYVLPGLCGV